MCRAIGFTAGPRIAAVACRDRGRRVPAPRCRGPARSAELIVSSGRPRRPRRARAARAGGRDVATLGVSLTRTGTAVFSITHSVIVWTYSGTWPTAAPMPRSLIPCGQPKLSSMPSAPVSLTRLTMSYQVWALDSTISETTTAWLGYRRLTSATLGQVGLDRAVADELDVGQADEPTAADLERAEPGGDIRDRLADRLPDDAPPTRVEGPGDHLAGVGDRARGQPEGVGAADAGHVGEQVHTRHGGIRGPDGSDARTARPSASTMEAAASLPAWTACTTSAPPLAMSPMAQTLGSAVRPVTGSAAATAPFVATPGGQRGPSARPGPRPGRPCRTASRSAKQGWAPGAGDRTSPARRGASPRIRRPRRRRRDDLDGTVSQRIADRPGFGPGRWRADRRDIRRQLRR